MTCKYVFYCPFTKHFQSNRPFTQIHGISQIQFKYKGENYKRRVDCTDRDDKQNSSYIKCGGVWNANTRIDKSTKTCYKKSLVKNKDLDPIVKYNLNIKERTTKEE